MSLQSLGATPRNTDRSEQILLAAQEVFSRYGFQRTSMGEIAKQAGLSRAALYHYFDNKEDVLGALCVVLHAKTLDDAKQAARGRGSFAGRLFAVLDAREGFFVRLLSGSPHRAEIEDATHRVTGEITREWEGRVLDHLAEVMGEADRAAEIRLKATGLSPRSAAELCLITAKGLKAGLEEGSSPELFKKRLRLFVKTFVRGVSP